MATDQQQLYESPLDAVLKGIMEALRGDPFFDDVTIVLDDSQDLVSELQKSLATMASEGGRVGAACVIEIPDLGVEHPNIPGPQFDDIAIEINLIENVLLNRAEGGTYKTARRLAVRAAHRLHHRAIPGLQKVLLASRVYKKNNPDTKDLIYATTLRTGGLRLTNQEK